MLAHVRKGYGAAVLTNRDDGSPLIGEIEARGAAAYNLGFPRSTTAAVVRAPQRDRWDVRRNQRIYNGLRLAPWQTGVEQPQP